MRIDVLVQQGEAQKVATAIDSGDGANWKWDYINKETKKHYNHKASWIYFIVKNGVVMKVGGTGMKLVDRSNFYANANKWSDKSGYCNAATNPLIWHHMNQGDTIELFALINPIQPIIHKHSIMGVEVEMEVNLDFRPMETAYREFIERYNTDFAIDNEDLIWDGRPLQLEMVNQGLKEVNVLMNKRIPSGFEVGNREFLIDNDHKACPLVPIA